jgi:hypothetical protein
MMNIAGFTSSVEEVVATVTAIIHVKNGAVIALIKGGSYRTSPIDLDFIIDASLSRDENVPPGLTSRLAFLWTCQVTSLQQYGMDCTTTLFEGVNTNTVVKIPSGLMNITYQYTITVLVSAKDGRQSRATLLLVPSVLDSPSVTITSIKSKVNVDAKLTLSGYIYAAYNVSASWQVMSPDGNILSVNPNTPKTITLTSPQAQSRVPFPLSFNSYSFNQGVTYIFQLTASSLSNDNQKSFSSISLTINAPPSGGYVHISPSSGTALITNFLLTSALWIDDVDGSAIPFSLRQRLQYGTNRKMLIKQLAAARANILDNGFRIRLKNLLTVLKSKTIFVSYLSIGGLCARLHLYDNFLECTSRLQWTQRLWFAMNKQIDYKSTTPVKKSLFDVPLSFF